LRFAARAYEDARMSVDDEDGGISRRGFVGAAGAAAITAPALAFAGNSAPIYRIHPAIGIARVGNADPSTYFIGPEAPGYGPLGAAPGTQAPPYKAADGRVKPQAARFRIYEYAMVNGRQLPVREVTLDTPGVSAIRWSVHLANKKASFYKFEGPAGESEPPGPVRNASVSDRASLEIDFGGRTIAGRSQAPVEFRAGSSQQVSCPLDVNGQPVIDYLGQLRTDASGRLIVLGGQGRANYAPATAPALASYANNDGWFDDISDGPVTAIVSVKGVGDVAVDARGGAWVLCPPPDFAPQIRGAVTAYDLLFDLAVRSIPISPDNGLYDDGGPLAPLRKMKADFKSGADFELPDIVPDFTTDIQPILLAGYNYWWVDGQVTSKHNSLIDPLLANPDPAYTTDRQGVLIYLRPPLGVNQPNGNRTMPHLLGDNPYIGSLPDAVRHLSLTHTQYALLRNWANNQFTPPSGSPPPPTISAHGLDQAALENASGGAFFPGIEFSWQMRNPTLFAEPFRLNLAAQSRYWGETQTIGPGHFSRQLALPWQADFNDCRDEGDYGWWPSQRPTAVLTDPSANKRVDWARPTVKFASGSQTTTHEDMVACWAKFGFVVASGELFVETERAAQVP
jgi:L-Lysine epsilon oxidase N-terminal/L-lysine epsilon oxidase C-terminal domain